MSNKEEGTKTTPDNLDAGSPANKESYSKLSPYQISRDNDNQEHKVNKPNLPVSNNVCFRFEENSKTPLDNRFEGSQKNSIHSAIYGFFCFVIGCISGWIYIVAISAISIFLIGFSNITISYFLVWCLILVLGAVLALLFAIKVKNKALFWGFVTPYFLLLLISGTCHS
jgi:hypothetical protein